MAKLNKYKILRLDEQQATDAGAAWIDEGVFESESAVKARSTFRESAGASTATIVSVPAKFWKPKRGSQQTTIKNVEVEVGTPKPVKAEKREPAKV